MIKQDIKNCILVTGGSGMIGSAVVKRFLCEGFKVIIIDICEFKNNDLLNEYSERLFFYKVDITNKEEVSRLFNKLELNNFRINHCVSLAGKALIEEFGVLDTLGDSLIEESIKLNLNSHIILAKNVIPLMKKCEIMNKSISFISSINALMDFGLPVYSAAKSGLLGFTKALSSELGNANIRVNCILPGTIVPINNSEEPKIYNKYLKGSLLGRFATFEEIAEVVYCLSEQLTCITGQNIVADCGQTSKGIYENY